jgi:HTH-type transcriptional regulator / antitoxin HipB
MYAQTNTGTDIMIVRNTRELGGFLRQAREDAGLTQAQLAAKLHVRRQRIIGLERGNGQILTAFVFEIMRELGVELTLQISRTVQPKPLPPDEKPLALAAYSIDDIAEGSLD